MANASIIFISCQQDPTAEEFEDKDWTFLIENVSQLYLCGPWSWLHCIYCYLEKSDGQYIFRNKTVFSIDSLVLWFYLLGDKRP